MRFSEAWLREWVNPQIDTQVLADQLSMAGLEVDAVEPAAAAFDGVVIGEVISKDQHPDADKLSVCTVNVGGDQPLQIVCGAKNVAAGMRVPVATVGAKLPGDLKIKKSKLRGIQSFGMICSASELGLAESSAGIMSLPADAPIGDDFRSYLRLDDACIDVDLTPDRGDCLSIAGIAREVGVLNRVPIRVPEIEAVAAQIDDACSVALEVPEACPHYVCRIIRGIDANATTPCWMVEKLRRSGLRAINPVVDVTNYVMLELGQPMHGFDLSRLHVGIRVRYASAGEKLVLLDGNDVELRAGSLVIADAEKPLALAGIMGGSDSGVTSTSVDILLESAFFMPLSMAGQARSYGLHTDSSHRFERGVDPQLQIKAIERATALLIDIVGGRPGPVVEQSAAGSDTSQSIALRRDRVARVLGVSVGDAVIVDILERLGMRVSANDTGWDVAAPSSRFDIAIEVDLIEEIGRIYGYANIPENLSSAPVSVVTVPEAQFSLERAQLALVEREYQEAITYSFISPEIAAAVTPDATPITLSNPISADMAQMRSSLWPGLLSTLMYNRSRQQGQIRLFESGLRFINQLNELKQEKCLSGLAFGGSQSEQWGSVSRPLDFFDVKADVESILRLAGPLQEFYFEPSKHPALHPGQSAEIYRGGVSVGHLGVLHPALQAKLAIGGAPVLFELVLKGLQQGRLPAYHPLSKFPAIRRDLAVVVDRSVSFAAIRDCIRRAATQSLRDIRLFDVYTGEKIDSGLKSLALGLILQETSHTLTDQEVDQATGAILAALASELSARLRE